MTRAPDWTSPDGTITLYCGDCAEVIPSLSVDLTVTSPPYDKLRSYRGFSFDFEQVAGSLYEATSVGGVVVWVVGDQTIDGSETGTSFKQALGFKEAGFNLHDTMIYQKAGVAYPDTNRYYQNFEYMFVLSKGKPRTANLLDDRPNIWAGQKVHSTCRQVDGSVKPKVCIGNVTPPTGVRYNVWRIPHNGKERSLHPATFPAQLAEDHIRSWSEPEDLVLDPFVGSGTTGEACVKLRRRFVGVEINEEYFDIARGRIEKALSEQALFAEATR